MAAIAPLAIFLWLRTGFDPFQSALVLGIPLGISFSIIYLVALLSNMSDPEAVTFAVATALWFPLLGGLVSIVGHFGAEREGNVPEETFDGAGVSSWDSLSFPALFRRYRI